MPKPSPLLYNLFALVFAGCGAVTLYLLAGGDTAPETRLAFAVCGVLTVHAALAGGLFRHVKIKPAAFRIPVWGRVFLVLLALCAGGLWFLNNMFVENYADHFAGERMKEQFGALMTYTTENGNILPPNMQDENLKRYLGSSQRLSQKQRRGDPFVWNQNLSSMNLELLDHSDKVVAAYSQKISDDKKRVVLMMDVKVKYYVPEDELQNIIRESDAAIVAAQRSKQAKPNPAKSTNAVH